MLMKEINKGENLHMKNDIIHLPIFGPQHRGVPNEIIENYEKLYEVVKETFPSKQFSRFFPMVGNSYDDANIRLMLVGRSPNGWTELNEISAEEFAMAAAREMLSFGFEWLENNGTATKPYTDENGIEKVYNINKSSFFRCTRKIINRLIPERASWERWFENIIWTNLYTIAPLHRGNAEGKLQDVQIDISKKLLVQHIDFYKPTHIIFVTDWDWWFERFADDFPNVYKIGDSKNDNVIGCGKFKNSRVVVTVRPDRTKPNKPNEEEFANDVYKLLLSK